MKEVLLFFLPRYGIVSKRMLILVCTIGGFILLSGCWMSYYAYSYSQKFPAHIHIDGTSYGGKGANEVYEHLSQKLASLTITIQTDNGTDPVSESYTADDIGLAIDREKVQTMTYDVLGTIPKPKILAKHLPIPLTLEASILEHTINELTEKHHFPTPTDANFTYTKDTLAITPAVDGRSLPVNALRTRVLDQLRHSLSDVTLSIKPELHSPNITNEDLKALHPTFEAKITRKHTIRTRNHTMTFSPQQLMRLFRIEKSAHPSILIADKEVTAMFKELAAAETQHPTTQITTEYSSGKPAKVTTPGEIGYVAKDTTPLARAFMQALKDDVSYQGAFQYKQIPFSKKSIKVDDIIRKRIVKYKVISWGVVQSDLATFKELVAETFKDKRGWAAANISFQYVTSGEDLTVVLSEPQRVANASPICDAFYSCRVGRFAIINDDRWRLATTAWTGTLRDYQHMVLNHETGHWLGRGHAFCGGSNQLAPVMQQQSMGLHGCRPNPWPLAWEIKAVRQ